MRNTIAGHRSSCVMRDDKYISHHFSHVKDLAIIERRLYRLPQVMVIKWLKCVSVSFSGLSTPQLSQTHGAA